MPKTVSMVISLTAITCVCGAALGALNHITAERIVEQILINKQLPAASRVLDGSSNDLLAERQTLEVGENRKNWPVVFPAKRDGESAPFGVAFAAISEKGFGGDIGVMVGFDTETGNLLGIAIATHSETPGIGARAATDDGFVAQFAGASTETAFRVKADGGQIDALTGATVTTRAVCDAVNNAVSIYSEHSEAIGQLDWGTAGSSGQGGEQ